MKRFTMYVLDGGFGWNNEYIPIAYSILDNEDKDSPINFLEFNEEEKELCEQLIDYLNNLVKGDKNG